MSSIITLREASSGMIILRKFYRDRGHINVPKMESYSEAYGLCARLRKARISLSPKICSELDRMGFMWQLTLAKDLRWYYNLGELTTFYNQNGHTRVPLRNSPYNALGSWVLRQRRDEKVLPREKRRLLNSIKFEWSTDISGKKNLQWKVMFERLAKYFRINGHSNVPDRYKADEKLGRWVSTVRYAEARLEGWKRTLLKTVRFNFSSDILKKRQASRKQLFVKIKKFFEKNGHANVPESYRDSKLAIAVAYLRQYPERISREEKSLLKRWKFLFSNDIKAKWDQLWEQSFKRLQQFQKRFGHCRVSSAFKDQQLARWVANQRKDEREKRLPEVRKKRLSSIGFAFYNDIAAMQERKWLDMYDKLVTFKKTHGTTIVKESYRDKKLAYWVQHQRQARKRMGRERIALLNKVKFVWRVR